MFHSNKTTALNKNSLENKVFLKKHSRGFFSGAAPKKAPRMFFQVNFIFKGVFFQGGCFIRMELKKYSLKNIIFLEKIFWGRYTSWGRPQSLLEAFFQ